jgi:hypothetical protein
LATYFDRIDRNFSALDRRLVSSRSIAKQNARNDNPDTPDHMNPELCYLFHTAPNRRLQIVQYAVDTLPSQLGDR